MTTNLTINSTVFPCRLIEEPNIDANSDEPVALKWQLVCEVDDAGYKAFNDAWHNVTFCNLNLANGKGILTDLQFFTEGKPSSICIEFTFHELALGGNHETQTTSSPKLAQPGTQTDDQGIVLG